MSDSENIVAGRNPVTEAIKAGRTIDKIYVKSGDKALGRVIALAKENKIPVAAVSAERLNEMCPDAPHQGIVARCAAKEYSTGRRYFVLCQGERRGSFHSDMRQDNRSS